jgi:hypothetical protein
VAAVIRRESPLGSSYHPAVRPKFLKAGARKVWYEMLAEHPAWTEFQLDILASYANLRADYEADPSGTPDDRIVEMWRQAALLLAPRDDIEDGRGETP